jgi:1,4-alpha-glucan branching enzyme
MIPKTSDAQTAHANELVPINFEFNNPDAVTVYVAGSFNDWNERTSPLTRGYGGRWGKVATLAPGNYEYCLVVDGRWILDPMNQVSVDNPYGGRNSVLTVEESKATAHLIDAEHQPFKVSKKIVPVEKLSGATKAHSSR